MDNKGSEAVLISLYVSKYGKKNLSVSRLPGSGSNRSYYRLTPAGNDSSVIGVIGEKLSENAAFISLARYFRSVGIHVPEIIAVSDDGMSYLQQDLGTSDLFTLIKSGADCRNFVAKCLKSLVAMQTLPEADWINLTEAKPMDRRMIMWDLNYFKYEYLKPAGIPFDEELLEDDFERLANSILQLPDCLKGFMYRDCQSRNIMLFDNEPYWIDFQGGRKGVCLYDAVSFLYQAKAGFSADFRRDMMDVYVAEYSRVTGSDKAEIKKAIPSILLLRTLQVLGAYGFRGLFERKAHFVESIPGALANLHDLIDSSALNSLPELKRLALVMVEDSRFKLRVSTGLEVTVFSFSYKKGYPDDFSGNGGGFMFDCRGMHNPGRYDEYKPLTGRDEPVKKFLEQCGEIQPFLHSAWEMIDPSVACYIRRGFTSLQIGFGCTGGRHRSVYSAEATARHIKCKFPEAIVRLVHREQDITEIIESSNCSESEVQS